MTIPQRKAHLKKLIDSVKDPSVLDKVARVLEKAPLQSPLVKRALKAEGDLRAGRFQTVEEFNREMDAFVETLHTKGIKARRRE